VAASPDAAIWNCTETFRKSAGMQKRERQRRLRRLEKARADAAAAVMRVDHEEHRSAEAERKERARELYRLGGIAEKAGLAGLDERMLFDALRGVRERLDAAKNPAAAIDALVKEAGLADVDTEVTFGILLRGQEILEEPGRAEALAKKGRERLNQLHWAKSRGSSKKPAPSPDSDQPPMMVKFEARPPQALLDELKHLGLKYFPDEQAWRGPNEVATDVRTAIRRAEACGLVAFPSDWRDA